MKSVKNFLIGFVVAYLVIAIGLNMLLGPPGMSPGYMEEFKQDHDHYIEVIKNKEYKFYIQRPHLVEASETLQQNAAFVEAYEAREEFQHEMHRRHIYELSFEFFNVLMLLVLIVPLARKPIMNLLERMIGEVREALTTVETNLTHANDRLETAEKQISGLDQDRAGYERLVEERIEVLRRDSALFTGQSMSLLNQETEERKEYEQIKAERKMKEIVVDAALEQIAKEAQGANAADWNDILIRQFTTDVGKSQ